MKELASILDPATSLLATVRSASSTGTSVDLANYGGNMVTFRADTITDGTHTPILQESADNATWSNVAAADVAGGTGPFTAVTAAQSNTLQKAGYVGALRYIRMTVTVVGATTGGTYSSAVTLGDKRKQP